MSQPTLIGVDIGTTNIKAVAFTLTGVELASVSAPTQTHNPRPDWAHYYPEELWDTIATALRQLCSKLESGLMPIAVAFSSMAETAVPLDADGQPVYHAIAWFDRRTIPQVEWLREHVGDEIITSITGLPLRPLFGVTKLLWLRENQPDAFRQTVRWLNMADYGAFRLCGAQATDYSLASRMLLLDLACNQWSTQLLDWLEIPTSLLGQLVHSGTLLGHVHAEAAAKTGLPEGMPVVSGGHDHVCGALALGITEPGDVFDSMGTAESLFVATEQPRLDQTVMQAQIGQGVHTVPNRYYGMGGIFFSGGCIDWVRQLLLAQAPNQSFDELIRLAVDVAPGSNGLFFLTHLRMANPPINDSLARGAFVGISSDAGPGHFARAVIEGVAYEYHTSYQSMMKAFELSPSRIIASGGGSRNRLLLMIKAALFNQPIYIPLINEATCLGAAMLAGIGAGIYTDFKDAIEQVTYRVERIDPDADLHAFYRERHESVYQHLYPTLRELNHVISKRFVG